MRHKAAVLSRQGEKLVIFTSFSSNFPHFFRESECVLGTARVDPTRAKRIQEVLIIIEREFISIHRSCAPTKHLGQWKGEKSEERWEELPRLLLWGKVKDKCERACWVDLLPVGGVQWKFWVDLKINDMRAKLAISKKQDAYRKQSNF